MKIICIGDSLMQFNTYKTFPQTGWVQLLPLFFKNPIKTKVEDYALNGRSTKSFIDEGQFDVALKRVKKGDIFLISFGHNDEKKQDPSRYTSPFTTYQENLAFFHKEITKKGGIVVFLSSIERLKYQNNELIHSHGDYILAMEEIAKKLNAYYIDLNKISYDFYSKHSFQENRKYIMTLLPNEYKNYPEGKEDTTHLTYLGALNICELAVPELAKIKELKGIFLK